MAETMVKTLNMILRDLREDHDLKQETVARYLGISQQTYSNYENGDIKQARLYTQTYKKRIAEKEKQACQTRPHFLNTQS